MVDAPPDDSITHFPNTCAIDSCSVSNILCSRLLRSAAERRGPHFVVAEFVRYECLTKIRAIANDADRDIMEVLRRELESERLFSAMSLTLEDLREVARLELIRRVGRGEIASIVIARKLRQGFMSDDRCARRLAQAEFPDLLVRTSSHFVGWLVYVGELSDGDIPTIMNDNRKLRGRGHIGKYVNACYEHAMLLRLKQSICTLS